MSIAQQVQDIIKQFPLGHVFSAVDFIDIGLRGNIDVILHRLAVSGLIRKLGYGLYDRPKKSSILGDLTPKVEDIISAYAKKMGQVFIPDPLSAANIFGITTQVPSKLVYLTNGKTHSININGIDIYFIHKSPKSLAGATKPIGLVLQALRYLRDNNTENNDLHLKKIASRLSDSDIKELRDIKGRTFRNIVPQIDRIAEIATIH